MICIVAWTATISGLYFYGMKRLGLLRVSLFDEIVGLDITEMGDDLPPEMMTKEEQNDRLLRKKTARYDVSAAPDKVSHAASEDAEAPDERA